MDNQNLKKLEDVGFVVAMAVAVFAVLCFALELLVKFILHASS
jgi:hypothetical protein